MGASSYLTRKPWGPASLRSTRAEGRCASAREGVSGSIPIDCRRVASAVLSSPRARSYVARLRNPSAGVGAYTKPERASRMSSRAAFPSTSIFAAFCSRYRSIERSSPSLYRTAETLSASGNISTRAGASIVVDIAIAHTARVGERRSSFPIVLTYATAEAQALERVAVLDAVKEPLSRQIGDIGHAQPLFPATQSRLIASTSIPIAHTRAIAPRSKQSPGRFTICVVGYGL